MQHAKLEFVTLNVILLSKVYYNIIGSFHCAVQ